MRPKGQLLIIGGAEDIGDEEFLDERKLKNFKRYEILKELLKKSKNKNIEIITTASEIPSDVKDRYERAFDDIDYPNPGFLSIREKGEANRQEYLSRIEKASAVFFTGGDQRRLTEILGNTKLINTLKKRYQTESNFLIAGTSAGAMAMSSIMIAGGGKREALYNFDLEIEPGFGFIENCIVDTHFIKRGRFSRLAHAIILHPDKLGIGLGENTALIIENGMEAECRGSGMVVVIDGESIRKTNIKDTNDHSPVHVEGLIVHLLVRGCSFSFKEKTIHQCTPKEDLDESEHR